MEHQPPTPLQMTELDLLRQFIQVCQALNLKYYMVGGTLLGAVRHKGFIPWDDDIDIAMPRADYEVFLQKGQALLEPPYFIQSFETDPRYPMNFAKLRNDDTTFVESSLGHLPIHHGVYIDIFPLDFYPDDLRQVRRLKRKKYFLSGRIAAAFRYEKLPLRSRLKHILCRLLHPSLGRTVRRQERLFRSVTQGSRLVNHCGAWGDKEISPAHWFAEGCLLEFEGLPVQAPKEYHLWLTQVYGDYMQLPPVEKRRGHHHTDRIDLNRPYIHYFPTEES